MQVLYLTTGKRYEIVDALRLEENYRLLLVRDEVGLATLVFETTEIDRIVTEPDPEPHTGWGNRGSVL